MKLTGSEIVAESLIRHRVPYVLGIPGHGALSLFDALIDRKDQICPLQVRHEQAAVHFADAYYRVTGQPLAVYTSIGPGATNTAVGLATAYLDSVPVLVVTGAVHTHMMGRGVLQEVERKQSGDFPRLLEPVVKRYWRAEHVTQLPYIMHRAFNQMLTGRRGPVHIDLPMDVQADSADVEIPQPRERQPHGPVGADPETVERIAELMLASERPILYAGGGVLAAGASAELKEAAELLGAAVLSTALAKGVFPEDHELSGWITGSVGSTVGHKLANAADVILAVGTRFTDLSCSSYVHGAAFSIPPTKLIHVDIDGTEIGKNYPVEIGLTADARSFFRSLVTALKEKGVSRDYRSGAWFQQIQAARTQWYELIDERRNRDDNPVTIPRCYKQIQDLCDDDAILITSAGNPQAMMMQMLEFKVPGANITSGGFSTMGYTIPAALGAKMGAPKRQVIGLAGDGDALMTIQELAMAAQYQIGAVIVVLNSIGWTSIRNLQMAMHGNERTTFVDFQSDGELISPDFVKIAEAFGIKAAKAVSPDDFRSALSMALESGEPFLIEVMINRTARQTGSIPTDGWWDMPVPTYLPEQREAYMRERAKEKLT